MIWFDLAIVLSCSGGGLVCGWIMHAIGGFGNHNMAKQAAASINRSTARDDPNRERISEVAERLKDYALTIVADVDAHQTRVQAVNNTLTEGNASSPEEVFEAVNQLIEANEAMQTQLQQAQDRIHEQTEQIESAERRAHTDALTRVPNRGAFDLHIEQQHSLGTGKGGTLALLDVDHFKQFNDVYGHLAGDEVLRVVAQVLYTRLHSYGLVARYGGEEFAVILDGCPIDQARDLVEQARIAIGQRSIQFEDKRLRVEASAGVAELAPDESIEDWLQRADSGMYRSKEVGRNCGHWMDGETPIRIESCDESDRLESRRRFDIDAALTAESAAHAASSNVAETPGTQTIATSKPVEKGPDSKLEIVAKPADDSNTPARKVRPSAFADLPNRDALGAAFVDIRTRTQSSVSVFVMAIHCNSGASHALMRSLLQVVRATFRSIDRIGSDDDSTLLVCMPSVDETTASERGQQICRSVEAIGLGVRDSSARQVSVGIAQAGPNEEFGEIVSRAVELARQALAEESDPVCLQQQRVSA